MADFIKGPPVRLFSSEPAYATPTAVQSRTDKSIDCRGFNAAHVMVFGSGSASLVMQGADEAGGDPLTLPDPSATQTLTANTSFEVVVGSAFLRGELTITSGTWTVIVTPYVSPGTTTVSVTGTPNQNLTQYGSTAVGAANAVHVRPGTGATWDVSDDATRDLGKVDVAALDQYTPQDVDTGAETVNALPVAIMLPAETPVVGGTATNPLRVDPTGTTVQPARVDQTTPGTTNLVESKPNCRRNAGALHRNAITAVDKITDFVDASVTIADNGVGTGSLVASTTYYVTAIPYNRWGPCKVNANIDTLSTAAYGANTGSIRATIAQATGADGYDLFLSTDAAPKWVGRITEAQRAAGDFEVTAVGTVAAGGGNPGGTVDINVAGTGIQTSNAVFAQNNAYTPASVTAVNCAGYSKAHVKVKVALTDLRSAPSLALVPFFANQVSGNDWEQGQRYVLDCLGSIGASLEQELVIDIDGSTGLVVLIDTIAGQGAACSIWVELA